MNLPELAEAKCARRDLLEWIQYELRLSCNDSIISAIIFSVIYSSSSTSVIHPNQDNIQENDSLELPELAWELSMNQADFFYPINAAVTACSLFVLMLAATEIGIRFGAGTRARRREEETSYIDFIQGGVLGLLSLLLGFTYAVAIARHDARTDLQVREANALGTAYLRAGLVSDPSRSELRESIRQYVDAAIKSVDVFDDRVKSLENLQRAERALQMLWPAGLRAIEGREPTEADSLLLQSLNDVIDLHEQRIAAFEYRVPKLILWVLFFVAVAAMALTGYAIGLNGSRKFFLTTGMSILVVAVILVIIDLQHPQQGFIRVSQKSMIRLHDRIQAEKSAETTPQRQSVPNKDVR